jgi:hypothetical protein
MLSPDLSSTIALASLHHDGLTNDISPRSIIINLSSIFASIGEVQLRQMQSVFDELELVMST